MREKEAAVNSGISLSLFRYYCKCGLLKVPKDGEFCESVKDEVLLIEQLLSCGFTEAQILKMKEQPDRIIEECDTLRARCEERPKLRAALTSLIREQTETPLSLDALRDRLSAVPDERENHRKKQMKSDIAKTRFLGIIAYCTLCVLLAAEGVLSITLRSSYWQIIAYAALLTVLFFGIEWVRFLLVSAELFDAAVLLLTLDHLGAMAAERGYLFWILLSLLLIVLTSVILLLSRNLQFFFYRRRNH